VDWVFMAKATEDGVDGVGLVEGAVVGIDAIERNQ
jgi:hypothetical protein